ncbi:hypothetical protein Gohar_002981 [Gossypium harknessii]|uniref:Uncharacterized protein n=1 Tax=Gossypium harknessii TaxID=34285 RepID=A0A7J9HML2_9ROSI|nr:hypothetical protein [Gossypium harknessii]
MKERLETYRALTSGVGIKRVMLCACWTKKLLSISSQHYEIVGTTAITTSFGARRMKQNGKSLHAGS